MTFESQSGRDLPVPWAKLKEVNDAHTPPRIGLKEILRLMMGLFLAGLSVFALVIAVMVGLDPGETVEPATGLVLAFVGLGFTTAVVGVLLLLDVASRGKPQS